MTPTPEDRACLEWAFRVVLGLGPESDVFVLRDLTVVTAAGDERIDPSIGPDEAFFHALAQAMKLHLAGIDPAEVRHDLVAVGMGVEAANRVHDHLLDISVEEWGRLGERVVWYSDDNGSPITASTPLSGVS
ncbi:hypothetical protein [Pseudooceanicola algae]|uniref:Uncharacterized protein n=1 Tax=Pseudooceanicola algae TaxID=1537215 RepID=A0A418SK97_9RHOB|nr:hypothetical protein [Pseudooceanicola algae]QPM89115.1 hypothetical protein PSAL_003250 [Pseudooceanicola algae]